MNERLGYRPLLAGVGIVPSPEGRWATLGLILTDNGRAWGLTALHALGNLSANPLIDIAQGPQGSAGTSIASCRRADLRLSQPLDVVAFPIGTAIATRTEVAGLGPWRRAARLPLPGERVVKVGARSGITAGRVLRVTGSSVEIERLPDYPHTYKLADGGDSGAVWFSHPALEPLAVHRALQAQGGRALATTVVDALAALGFGL